MNKKDKEPAGFEQRLEALETLVKKMESGGLRLAELLKLYEEGVQISRSLNLELDAAQAKLLKLKGGVLQEAEEDNGV